MESKINAASGGLTQTAGSVDQLHIQTAGVSAITVDQDQNVNIKNTLTFGANISLSDTAMIWASTSW